MTKNALDRFESVVVATNDLEGASEQVSRLFGCDVPTAELDGDIYRRRFLLENTALDLVSPHPEAKDSWLSFWLEKRGEGPLGFVFRCPRVAGLEPELDERSVPLLDDMEPFGASVAPEATRGVPIWLSDLEVESRSVDRGRGLVHGLDHAVVQTVDGDATRRVYEEGLGVRVALDRTFEQWNVRLIFCRLGEVTLEIASRAAESAGEDEELPRDGLDQLWGFTWRVDDADIAHERMASEGFELSEVREGRRPGTRVFTVRSGTLGIPTLIIEPKSPSQ
ncbi:MAG: VOC family protein [Acidobacteriota bacterium]